MKHSVLPLIVIVIVGVMMIAGAAMRFIRSGPAPSVLPFALIPTSVPTAVATRSTLSHPITCTAAVLPARDVDVVASGDGFISSLAVSSGDSVLQGQLVAVIDSTAFTNRLMSASRALAAAHDERTRAEGAYVMAHRNHLEVFNHQPSTALATLVTSVVTVATDEHHAETQWLDALHDEERLSRQVADLLAEQRDHAVRAPLTGIIASINVQPGDLAYGSHVPALTRRPLMTMRPNTPMRLSFDWDKASGNPPAIGSNVTYRLDTETTDRSARITRVTTAGEDASQPTTSIECDIAQSDGLARKATHAAVRMDIITRIDAVTIPPEAIDHRDGGAFVRCLDAQNIVVDQPINPGIATPSQIEVVSGLEPGSRVIVGHPSGVTAGMQVTPRP